MAKIVYVDMDGVLVDFHSGLQKVGKKMRKKYKGREDEIPRVFSLMEPMPGAIETFHALQESDEYDAYILSTASWHNPTAWSDKLVWIQTQFGKDGGPARKRLILTHHKNLNSGAILIDDHKKKNGADEFDGQFIHFGSKEFPDWTAVRRELGLEIPK